MSNATYTLSAFGDEIATALTEQVALLQKLNVGYLELRKVDGKNVLKLSDEEAEQAKATCDSYQVCVSSIGSPIGKSPMTDPIENEIDNLKRATQVGRIVGTTRVRIFSFYPPDTSTNAHYDQYVDEAIVRLSRLAEVAQAEGMTLYLENEKEVVGDTVARCHALMVDVNHPHLRFAWDPANFVQVGEANLTGRGWPLLGEYTNYVHIKDAMLADGSVRPAGEGDGRVGELLDKLNAAGYQGMLALEPHLVSARRSSGFSGADGMTLAVEALRKLMAAHGCAEVRPTF